MPASNLLFPIKNRALAKPGPDQMTLLVRGAHPLRLHDGRRLATYMDGIVVGL